MTLDEIYLINSRLDDFEQNPGDYDYEDYGGPPNPIAIANARKLLPWLIQFSQKNKMTLMECSTINTEVCIGFKGRSSLEQMEDNADWTFTFDNTNCEATLFVNKRLTLHRILIPLL